MYQNLTVLGAVGRNAEIRFLPSGQQMAVFSLAASRVRSGRDGGDPIKETTWYQVTAFGKLAEFCVKYVEKGARVLVTGRLRPDPVTGGPRIWTKKDGKIGASFEVVAESLRLLDWPDREARGGFTPAEPADLEPVMEPEFDDLDEVPF